MALEGRFNNCTICEAGSVEETIECLEEHSADIVLLSVDGYSDSLQSMMSQLKDYALDTPILVVGDAISKPLVKEIFRYNIRGFLDRSASRDITLAAVQLILAGGQYFPPEAHDSYEANASETDVRSHRVRFSEGIRQILTPRQIQVLQAISEGKSNKAIADELGISAGTVKVHVSNLMKDLQAKNRTQAVSIATNLHLL
ncbi:MAG: response regulator transcription factor [Sneathiella sp.]